MLSAVFPGGRLLYKSVIKIGRTLVVIFLSFAYFLIEMHCSTPAANSARKPAEGSFPVAVSYISIGEDCLLPAIAKIISHPLASFRQAIGLLIRNE